MALLLIVDEDKDAGSLLARTLAKHGHEVVIFEKSMDALEWLEHHSPQLAIVSAGRRGEKAKSLLASLRASGLKGSHLVLSANEGSMGPIRKDFAGSVGGFLVKGLDLEKLEEMVRSWIQNS